MVALGHARRRAVGALALATAVATVAWAATRGPSTPRVFVVSSLVDVRPRGTPGGDREAHLDAARGEWEAFQVVVRAGSHPLRAVTVEAAPLAHAGARVEARVYRVGFVRVETPSNVEGARGDWPDPLIPVVDDFDGQRRNAFPVEVAAGHDVAAWIEVHVARDAPTGTYRGAVSVRDGATALARIPVELRVHAAVLPATSSFPVTYGFSTGAALAGHRLAGAPDDPAGRELERRYALEALRHRISLHGLTFTPPPSRPDGTHVDFAAYDAEVGPFLDGTADATGARWSAFDLRVPVRLDGAARAAYLRETVAHLRAKGWLDRVFAYVADEPPDAQLDEVRRRAVAIHDAAPAIPRLVTRALVAALDGAVDVWCPPVNTFDDKPGGPPTVKRAQYDARIRRGERLWWYQSCLSHGCDEVGRGYFTGWPSLVVDAPPVAERIQPWLGFRARIGGQLYYNTVEAYTTRDGKPADPWRDLLRHGGNGDGTLFYPGRPDVIGGTTQVPVASIRLARVRDGLEDGELLRALAARDGFAAADALAAPVAARPSDFAHDPSTLLAAHRALLERLDAGPEQSRGE